jgi:hypothetical protein
MSKERVYKVKMYNPTTDGPILSRRMATLEGAATMGGWIVEGSGFVIDQTELEGDMGWTALDFDPVALGYEKAKD